MAFALGMGLGIARTQGVGFSLPAFLAAMDDGFSFDFTKTDRHFQENTGPTLADDATEAIGLALESREWNGRTLAEVEAAATELLTNGSFAADANWTKGAGWTISGGVATHAVGSNSALTTTSFTAAQGGLYALRHDIVASAGVGALVAAIGATGATGRNANGSYRDYILAPSASAPFFYGGNTFDGAVDNASVKLVPGNHGVQSSASLKGTRQVFYGYSDDQPELAPNTTFDDASDCTRTVGAATMASVGGRLRLTATDTNPSRWSMPIECEIGETYRISGDVITAGGAAANISVSASSALFNAVAFSNSASSTRTDVLTFTATANPMYVGGTTSTPTVAQIAEWDNFTVKKIPASRITTGCKYDGSDDNHLTTYLASSGENFIVAYVNVPTTISAPQIIAGANDASSTNRWFIAFNTSGQLCGGVGGQSVSTILSTAIDWRGKSVVVGISCDGATVRLFADDEIVYEAAQSGTPTTSTPLRIGSNNAAGTAASFTAATVGNVIAGPEYLDLATFLKIRNKLIDP